MSIPNSAVRAGNTPTIPKQADNVMMEITGARTRVLFREGARPVSILPPWLAEWGEPAGGRFLSANPLSECLHHLQASASMGAFSR